MPPPPRFVFGRDLFGENVNEADDFLFDFERSDKDDDAWEGLRLYTDARDD